jgi:NitT/TauT family transport system substrate-binding protein
MKRSKLMISGVAVATAALLAACSSGTQETPSTTTDAAATDQPAAGPEPATITVAATAPVAVGFPSFWLAEGFGFFEDEALTVNLEFPDGIGPQLLRAGTLQIAGVDVNVIPEMAQSDDLVFVMQTDLMPFLLVTFADLGYDSIADLAGTKVGINDASDTTSAQFLLANGGLNEDDYELVPVGDSAVAVSALENGEISAFLSPFRSGTLIVPTLTDREVTWLKASEPFPGSGLMVTRDYLANNRDIVVRFARAIARATVWQYENPALAAEVLLKMVPEDAQDVAQMTQYMELTNSWHRSVYDNNLEWVEADVQRYIDAFADLGLIDASFPATDMYTNDLHDEIFSFGLADEQAAARAATENPAGS